MINRKINKYTYRPGAPVADANNAQRWTNTNFEKTLANVDAKVFGFVIRVMNSCMMVGSTVQQIVVVVFTCTHPKILRKGKA